MRRDLAIYQSLFPGDSQPTVPAVFDQNNNSYALVGPYKLAFQFLMKLYRIIGSQPNFPEKGVTFYSDALSSSLHSPLEVAQSFGLAVSLIKSEFAESNSDDLAPEETFSNAKFLSASFNAGVLTLSVQVISQAGDSAVATLPIKV